MRGIVFGKEGAFAPMLKRFIEAALTAEMKAHLNEQQREGGNKRNGKGIKTIKSLAISFEVNTTYALLKFYTVTDTH